MARVILENALATLNGMQSINAVSMVNAHNIAARQERASEDSGDGGARPGMRGLAGLFEAQVERTPAAPAVRLGDRTVTYQELNAEANRLARRLIARGVMTEDAVGICLERSVEMVVALLAILKTGAAYVPLDPSYPVERLQFMMTDSAPRIVLTQRSQAPRLSSSEPVCLDDEWQSQGDERSDNPGIPVTSNSLAYLMYTSGSTGQPKAVALEQGPLCNLLRWQMKALPAAARTLQFASLNFDVSFQEIFSTLATGGTLVLVTEGIRRDPVALLALIEAEGVERLFMPFVALQQLAATAEVERTHPSRLRHVIAAGEQLRITPQVRHFFAHLKGCALHNHYGPTESHVVTAHTLAGDPAEWPDVAPIGRPIDGATIHILDEKMKPVPPGETGDLYIGGPCLARGYLNRPELTSARFPTDPFCNKPGARLYRSGDRARAGTDGILEFTGRSDDQIKVRGVRVEPGEVEAALSQHPALQQVAVTAYHSAGQGQRLAAYYVGRPGQGVSRSELRSFLIAKLPLASLPSAFVALDQMPLTATGKVDRRALPPPSHHHAEPPVAPRTALEKQLVAIWEKVLEVSPVGIRDDFSELGGDSLRAVEMALAIEKKFGIRVPVGKLFEFPTIQVLAEYVGRGPRSIQETDVVGLNTAGTNPPLFSVLGSLNVGLHLGSDQPFYQLLASAMPPGPFMKAPLDRTTSADNAIYELAEHCIRAIRAIQPHGPYCLSGYSLGGIVAFEIAHQLHLQGEKIALLALFDPDPPRATRRDLLIREIDRLGCWTAMKKQIQRVGSRTARSLKMNGREGPRHTAGSSNGEAPPAPETAIDTAYRDLPTEKKLELFPGYYRAPACPCRLALFLAEDRYEDGPRKPILDPRLDWKRVAAKGCDVFKVSGDHFTINDVPHAHSLADQLRTFMAKVFTALCLLPFEAQSAIEFPLA